MVSQANMNAYASSASRTKPMLARKKWYCRQRRPGAVPSPRPKVACRKDRNADGWGAEQNQKHAGKPVETQMNGQVRKPDGQYQPLRRRMSEACCCDERQRGAYHGAHRKERPSHEGDAQRPHQSCKAYHAPCGKQQQT